MNEKTKRAFLTILRTGLKRFLVKSHPFVGCVPAKNGKRSTHTFKEDLREVLDGSEIFIMSNPTISALVSLALEVIGLDVSTEIAVEYTACRMSTKGELPKENPILLGLFYEYIVFPVMRIQQLAVQNLIKGHPRLLPEERIIMRRGENIAQLFDVLFFKWWRCIVIPYQLSIARDPAFEKADRNEDFENCYAILGNMENFPIGEPLTHKLLATWLGSPLSETFPSEIKSILSEITHLQIELNRSIEKTVDLAAPRNYFSALFEVLSSTKLEVMEELWGKVDVAWTQIDSENAALVHMTKNGSLRNHKASRLLEAI